MKNKKYYKLTEANMQTYQGFQWTIGKTVKTSGQGKLCTDGWIHCYTDPVLAVLLNPIHANFQNSRLFEVQVAGKYQEDYGLKIGWSEVTLIKELPLPSVSTTQRVLFAILCAKLVYKDPTWLEWASNWIKGTNRSYDAAHAAAYTVAYADDAAAYAAAYAASSNADAAAHAAAAAAAAAANAAVAAADAAAYAAAYAASSNAYAAAHAAAAAAAAAANAAATIDLDIIGLAHQVIYKYIKEDPNVKD